MARAPSPKCKDSSKRRYGVDGLITRWFAYRARRPAARGGLSLAISIHSRTLARRNERTCREKEMEIEKAGGRERERESERMDTD